MSHELTAVLFGLVAAALWGAGDFSGGIASKKTHVFVVLIISQIIGLMLMIVLALLNRETVPPISDLMWACAAGISGGIGVAALYRALAIGQMGIAAPIAAVFTAVIPVLVGVFTEGFPGLAQLIGFALALAGVWILSRHDGAGGNRSGIGLAVLAGVGFGMLLVGLDRAGSTGGVFWPLTAARISSILFMSVVAVMRRTPWIVERERLPVILIAGLFDVLGNAAYVIASQLGRLDVAAVLSSVYPASTVLLAWLILKEKISRTQMIAIGVILLSVILITLPRAA